jgi:hypothetical protein
MNKTELEKKLERGEQWGFRMKLNTPECLGWILISKQKPYAAYPRDAFTHEELYQHHVKGAARVKETPYHVLIIEILREAHESEKYEDEEDYRRRDNYYFSTLDDVEKLVEELGYKLEDIKWRAELDAP